MPPQPPPPPQPKDCPRCQGAGAIILGNGKVVECPQCHGSGKK